MAEESIATWMYNTEADEADKDDPDFTVTLDYDESAIPTQTRQELAGMKNEPGAPFTRDVITENTTLSTHLSGRFLHIEYGDFFGLPSCIIVMKFKFHPFKPSTGTRFKSASVQVEFSAYEPPEQALVSGGMPCRNAESEDQPEVLAFAPELVYGEVSKEQRKWHWELAVPVGYTDSAFNAGLNATVGGDREYVQGNRAAVIGSETGQSRNGILWTLEESKTSEKGIRGVPAIFNVACLVRHRNRPFQGRFKVKGHVGFTMDPGHWLPLGGSRDEPCIFTPGYEKFQFGKQRLGKGPGSKFNEVDLSVLTTFTSL